MVVRKVNGIEPVNGVIDLPLPTLQYPGETRPMKMWAGQTLITNGQGEWTIDISEAGFTNIKNVQVTAQSNTSVTADKPVGCHVASISNTTITGKAYKVSSAGLLAAMQQINADNGTGIHVLVIGF